LDQFLEHLVAVGIEKIIRIGGRSQSTILEGKNISIVSQGETKTRFEGYLLAKTYEGLESSREIHLKTVEVPPFCTEAAGMGKHQEPLG